MFPFALFDMVLVTCLVRKLARCYACCTFEPSDLLKKRKKLGEYAGEIFCTFICINTIFYTYTLHFSCSPYISMVSYFYK